MTLSSMQGLFAKQIVLKLFPFIYSNGVEVTIGECYRNHELELAAQAQGLSQLKACDSSTHELKLAIDLNFFKNGVWLTKTEDYEFAGEYWEKLSPDGVIIPCWGGRWGDADHFSFQFGNVK